MKDNLLNRKLIVWEYIFIITNNDYFNKYKIFISYINEQKHTQ